MMKQYEVVFPKPMEGYEHVAIHNEDGSLVVKTVMKDQIVDKAKYFVKVSAEDRAKVKKWLEEQGESDQYTIKAQFLRTLKEAVKKIDYDYWIATIEPSRNNDGIYYAEGKTVGVGIECMEWKMLAEKYAPERGSRMSYLTEVFMWYALRIVEGKWTLEEVVNNSSRFGNYKSAYNATGHMEKTGTRVCAGYKDGQGNSYRIAATEHSFALIGGDFYNHGNECPVATVFFGAEPFYSKEYGAAVVVLTKEPSAEKTQ